jgi:hypothetical protein
VVSGKPADPAPWQRQSHASFTVLWLLNEDDIGGSIGDR